MKIIDNLNGDTHFDAFRALFIECEKVLITSPFLSESLFCEIFDLDMSKLKEFTLITTLKVGDPDQINKALVFKKLKEIKDSKGITVKILINNYLHGKVYIFDKKQSRAAIITSANFTEKGLKKNHEWGVELSDTGIINGIENDIIGGATEELPFGKIDDLAERVQKYKDKNKLPSNKCDLDLSDFLESKGGILKNHLEKAENVWLKPSGVSDAPIGEDEVFNIDDRLYFAKRAIGIKEGDIIVVYGVGVRKILAIYIALSEVKKSTEEEINDENWKQRWPWYVFGKNITPKYGEIWATHELYIKELGRKYLSLFPAKNITTYSNSLGTLNYGADKVRLDRDFADYIIKEVGKLENK